MPNFNSLPPNQNLTNTIWDPQSPTATGMTTESDFVNQRAANLRNGYEGPALPPPIRNGTRVQAVTHLALVRQVDGVQGSDITISWLNPEVQNLQNVNYQIYVYKQDNNFDWTSRNSIYFGNRPAQTLLAQSITDSSPATITVSTNVEVNAIITVQTRLSNGFTSLQRLQPFLSVFIKPISNVVAFLPANTNIVQPLGLNTVNQLLIDCNSASKSVTVPDINTIPDGTLFFIKKIDTSANILTIQPAVAAQLINGAATLPTTSQIHAYMIIADKVRLKWWAISSDYAL